MSVQLPRNLVPYADEVEQYVEQRIKQFAELFTRRFGGGMPTDNIGSSVTQAIDELRRLNVTVRNPAPVGNSRQPQAKMVFTHTCRSSGCGEADCLLCKHNPERRCTRHVKAKYLVEDRLRAACSAPVFIDMRAEDGSLSDIPCLIQLQLLDGQKYDEMAKGMPIPPTLSDAEACLIPSPKGLKWVKGPDVKPGSEDELKVVLPVEGGRVNLEDVMIMVSSEAILTGYRPNFRLLAVALNSAGQPLSSIPFSLSDAFVATTRRVKNTVKVEIPLVNDDISKLVHMGRATVEKMQNLLEAGRAMNIALTLPNDLVKVNTVGAFQKLVEACEKDRTLKGKVMQVLKLNHDKWEEAAQHSRVAVVPDFRPRVWVNHGHSLGIVFKCRRGAVQLEQPEGLVQLQPDGSYNAANIIAISDVHNPATLQITQQLRMEAADTWNTRHHPGWGIIAPHEEEAGPATTSNTAPNAGTPANTNVSMQDADMLLEPPHRPLSPADGADPSSGVPHLPSRTPPNPFHHHLHERVAASQPAYFNPASSPFTHAEGLSHSSGMTITTAHGNSKDPRNPHPPPHLHRAAITTTSHLYPPPSSAPPPTSEDLSHQHQHQHAHEPPPLPVLPIRPTPNHPFLPPVSSIPWMDPTAPLSPFVLHPTPSMPRALPPASAPSSVPPLFQQSNPQSKKRPTTQRSESLDIEAQKDLRIKDARTTPAGGGGGPPSPSAQDSDELCALQSLPTNLTDAGGTSIPQLGSGQLGDAQMRNKTEALVARRPDTPRPPGEASPPPGLNALQALAQPADAPTAHTLHPLSQPMNQELNNLFSMPLIMMAAPSYPYGAHTSMDPQHKGQPVMLVTPTYLTAAGNGALTAGDPHHGMGVGEEQMMVQQLPLMATSAPSLLGYPTLEDLKRGFPGTMSMSYSFKELDFSMPSLNLQGADETWARYGFSAVPSSAATMMQVEPPQQQQQRELQRGQHQPLQQREQQRGQQPQQREQQRGQQ